MNQPETNNKLEDLPNIGGTLAELLHKTGINSPEELYKNGTFQAFLKIKAIDTEACFSKLCAIEGAIEGIRWHNLSKEKKAELKQFFSMVNK
jgi:DNA transformation protein